MTSSKTMYHKLATTQRTIAWLAAKELAHLDWSISTSWGNDGASLDISFESLGEDEDERREVDRRLKVLFPTDSFDKNWDNTAKHRVGTRTVDEGFSLKCTVSNVMSCWPLTPEEVKAMSDEAKDDYFVMAIEGKVTIMACEVN